MSNQLIPVFTGQINNQSAQLVDARELHAFIGSSQEFANWIKNRIDQYGFIDGSDFLIILSKRGNTGLGRKKTDYHLTMDMAKELSMVERNEQGKEARRYFINCEKELLNASTGDNFRRTAIDKIRMNDVAEFYKSIQPAIKEVKKAALLLGLSESEARQAAINVVMQHTGADLSCSLNLNGAKSLSVKHGENS